MGAATMSARVGERVRIFYRRGQAGRPLHNQRARVLAVSATRPRYYVVETEDGGRAMIAPHNLKREGHG